jgi:hypothetical protein
MAMAERTGKTGTFIRTVELSSAKTCLVLTKKAAIDGILDQIESFGASKDYTVTNYQSLHKLQKGDYDVIVLDEFHQSVCAYPKPSITMKSLIDICRQKPIIYVSATPFSESYSQAYHPLYLSEWSPFQHKNFYAWHKEFGIDTEIYMHGRAIKQYNLTNESVIRSILSKYMITGTRQEVGFEHEPEDKIHIVELDTKTKVRINAIKKDKVLSEIDFSADSSMREINGIYQLSGGGVTTDIDEYLHLSSEKIDYIHSNFDINNTAIMCHYIQERERLKSIFPHVYSSTSDAEGVDLSHFENLIIYSQNFSTSKHSQRRARQANIKRDTPIVVHFLIADAGIDRYVYESVSKKQENFTARVYTQPGLFE